MEDLLSRVKEMEVAGSYESKMNIGGKKVVVWVHEGVEWESMGMHTHETPLFGTSFHRPFATLHLFLQGVDLGETKGVWILLRWKNFSIN